MSDVYWGTLLFPPAFPISTWKSDTRWHEVRIIHHTLTMYLAIQTTRKDEIIWFRPINNIGPFDLHHSTWTQSSALFCHLYSTHFKENLGLKYFWGVMWCHDSYPRYHKCNYCKQKMNGWEWLSKSKSTSMIIFNIDI